MTRKIDLMIIGTLKAGTTSLKNYLIEHPEILGHTQIDMRFFSKEDEFKRGYDCAYKHYFNEGDLIKSKKVVAKNAGGYISVSFLKKLYEHNPNCKLILVIRNPVERAYSNYNFEVSSGRLDLSLDEIINNIDKENKDSNLHQLIIGRGQYFDYMEGIYKYFKKENVRIFLFDDFKKDPEKICGEVFEWLGVNSNFVPQTGIIHNKTQISKSKFISMLMTLIKRNKNITNFLKSILPSKLYTKLGYAIIELNTTKQVNKPLDYKTKNILIDYFKPYNNKLEELTGLDLSRWNK